MIKNKCVKNCTRALARSRKEISFLYHLSCHIVYIPSELIIIYPSSVTGTNYLLREQIFLEFGKRNESPRNIALTHALHMRLRNMSFIHHSEHF